MAQVAPRFRRAFAAIAVVLLHAAIMAALLKGLDFAHEAERDFVPLSLKFFPDPPPPIPYTPQAFAAPWTVPRLNSYAPLPELVVPFVLPGNAITPPRPEAEKPLRLGSSLGCSYANFETLSPEDKLRCGAILARAAKDDAALSRTPTAHEAALEAEWAASLRKPPPLAAMPAHEIYGDWWQGMFWPMPNNSLDQKLMK